MDRRGKQEKGRLENGVKHTVVSPTLASVTDNVMNNREQKRADWYMYI
jgi:hypothetical protein